VFSWAESGKRHSELAQRFIYLQAKIVAKDFDSITEIDVNRWDEKIRMIEAGEPAALTTLVSICQNQIAIAANQPDKVVELKWYQKCLAHFFDLQLDKKQISA
jgi:hypothetical protein